MSSTRRRRAFVRIGFVIGFFLTSCKHEAPPPEPAKETCASGSAIVCERDCDGGNDQACDSATRIDLENGDGVKATNLLARLCDAGRRRFCPSYAFALAVGQGTAKDVTRARELFTQTCEYDPTACSEFGNLFASGQGMPKDIDLAHLTLDLACQHAEQKACEELDPLLDYACGQGHGASCNELAVLRSKSGGPKADPAEVAKLFRRGCDQSDAAACRNLAVATSDGLGVTKDSAAADKLFDKACGLGSKSACDRKRIEKK